MSAFNFINATVLQVDNDNFVCNPCGGYGKTMPIPTDNVQIGAEYWARPVKRDFFQGFRYFQGAVAPTFDSIKCFKLTNLLNSQYFYIAGSIADYTAASAACCGTSPVPTMVVTLADIAPCQDTCTSDGTNYTAFFAVETLADIAGGRFVSKVSVDGTLVNQQTFATGSTSIANLITYLNANAASAGTWSNPSGNTIKLVTTLAKSVCFIACIKTA